MREQKMSERIAELEQQLAQAEVHHQFHHAQEEQTPKMVDRPVSSL